ncbi:iron-sulfur cluster assembly scaffold protein [Zavarzinia aquatilis]|uniref:Iron-sulfur cluster assembly scaffold protein n=1 Tax=Zavarzinia aquatilis TaxID=2211142 RepID=A0A317DT81_9PROT|nr:iron-sulfur cluster assembly scaffold protein [Zavarzinia aquatilis]PWR17879.1 iron-sulfur cluster assembly scaffold protein [Zavarzinia aquatilis]
MSDELYPRDMLRTASDIRFAGSLPDAGGHATLDNPFCGDRVGFDVTLADGRIKSLRHQVKACVICQASAALLSAEAEGRTADDILDLGDRLMAGLKQDARPLLAGHPAFDLFTGITRHRARFACVLLPFEALEAATREAEKATS